MLTTVFLSVLSLIPFPQRVIETGGVSSNLIVTYETDAALSAEGYRLRVTPEGVRLTSSSAAGRFYAERTLAQLQKDGVSPCVDIEDGPAYPWRGVLIDESRHFLGKETVKRLVDLMSDYRFNRLHWHLTDDQGWRLEVPGLPELVQYGSLRAESPKRGAKLEKLGDFQYRSERNGQPYGPYFYRRADIEEIVDYAAARHVTVVPEIELPGHSRGAVAAYPELTCFPERVTERLAQSDWGISTEVLCVGNDETLRFLEKVLDYVCEVFPSPVVHIGGDECPRVAWERCPKCRARMKAEGLKTAGELQAWITRKMADHLARKGRRIMGWDEFLNGDVPANAIGQSWRTQASEGAGTEHVSAAMGAERGFDMVMSPHTECYYSYSPEVTDDPFQYSGYASLPLARAYRFDPMTGVSAAARAHVLGAEACCWERICLERIRSHVEALAAVAGDGRDPVDESEGKGSRGIRPARWRAPSASDFPWL